MKAIKILSVLVLSLVLAISAYGDAQGQNTDSKPAHKQQKKAVKQNDRSEKKGFKSHFKNPFKAHPKAQEADCRKYPKAAGCPGGKPAKTMEKQVSRPQPKTSKQGKPVQKQAFRPAQKAAKKNVKTGKAPVKKGHASKQPAEAKN